MFRICFVRNSDFIEGKDTTDMRNLKFPSRFYTNADLIYNYEESFISKNTLGGSGKIGKSEFILKLNKWFFGLKEKDYYSEEHYNSLEVMDVLENNQSFYERKI